MVLKYIENLIKLELVHQNCDAGNFPPIPDHYESPYKVENIIIEYGDYLELNIKEFCRQIKVLGVQAIELRFYDFTTEAVLERILKNLKRTKVREVILYTPSLKSSFSSFNYEEFITKHQLVSTFFVMGSEEFSVENTKTGRIVYLTAIHTDNFSCGKISKKSFTCNLPMYLQGKHENTCLSRKISISRTGDIKNCLSMKSTYGQFPDDSLLKIVNIKEFKSLWYITKENVKVCQDCEFRLICVDCRAFIEEPNNILSKPAKCKYDPYNGTWN